MKLVAGTLSDADRQTVQAGSIVTVSVLPVLITLITQGSKHPPCCMPANSGTAEEMMRKAGKVVRFQKIPDQVNHRHTSLLGIP